MTVAGSTLEWEELSGERSSGRTDLVGSMPDSGVPTLTVTPDGDSIVTASGVFDVDGGDELASGEDYRFLARTEDYDIYSTQPNAFEADDAPMGTIVGVPRD